MLLIIYYSYIPEGRNLEASKASQIQNVVQLMSLGTLPPLTF